QLLFYYLLEPLRPSQRRTGASNSNTSNANSNAPVSALPDDGMVYSRPSSPVAATTAPPKRLSRAAELDRAEAEIEARKLQIQRFGATWIKPPGLAKTYQVILDEEAEREEEEMDVDGEDGEV